MDVTMAETRTGPSAEQLALLRRLATREAARRQQQQHQQQTPLADGVVDRGSSAQAGPSTAQTQSSAIHSDASLMDSAAIEALLRDERSRNDMEDARVRQRLARLADAPDIEDVDVGGSGNKTDRQRQLHRKRLELKMLEQETAAVDASLSTLEEPQSDAVLALLTRAAVASAVAQFESAMLALRRELSEEQARLDGDAGLLANLQQVRAGLDRRREVIKEKARLRVDAAAITRKLQADLAAAEADLSRFLKNLINISDSLFAKSDSVHRAQLRHLIDTLINRAWDTPTNPFVDVSEDYVPAIVEFVLRANIAVEHPRDARRVRLIDFARSTRP